MPGTQAAHNNQGENKNSASNEEIISDLRPNEETLTFDLKENVSFLKKVFCYPINHDFVIRQIYIKSIKKQAVLIFLQGMVDVDTIEEQIIKPLLQDNTEVSEARDIASSLISKIITGKNAYKTDSFKQVTKEIVNGNSILIIQGLKEAIILATVGYEHRPIQKTTSENTLKGPKEAFIESEQTNRSLIRKYVRDEKLVTETIDLGGKGSNIVIIMYIVDLANDDLVKTVKSRVQNIQADKIQSLSILEQYIEDRPYSLVPTVLSTERPDRVAAFLSEGHVAVLMDGSPEALIAPVTFWSLFQNPEDQYQRWTYGNFIRLIRILCCFIALLAPGLFIAVTSYHVDMIPTDLVLAIAASREKLPFPAFIEVLIMEISFELLREAGIRIPTPIGPTIGIVGALILGQAAVEANIVSPILVIIVAITGLASFAIPEMSLSFMIRIGRFLFLIAGASMGFYAIAALFTICIAYLSSVQSFGVYFMSPFAPNYNSSKDLVVRPPVWKQWLRPLNIKPKQEVRDKKS